MAESISIFTVDLYQAIDAGCSDQILSLKKADIPGIQVILKERTQSYYPPVRDFAAGALHVIQNLLDAETRKRESAHSRRNSVHDGSNSEIEPVGQVLQVGAFALFTLQLGSSTSSHRTCSLLTCFFFLTAAHCQDHRGNGRRLASDTDFDRSEQQISSGSTRQRRAVSRSSRNAPFVSNRWTF